MALEVFYSYSHKDEALRDELEKHLALLKRQGLIANWHDRRIGAGDEWRDQIGAYVRSAHIILLLISADFLASDYCYDVEMKLALERHAAHEAVVIPIILRPVDWSGAPFAHLQALPRDAKPLTAWSDRDEAFVDIARGIRELVLRFGSGASQPTSSGIPSLVDGYVPKGRVLDAAMPSHVVKHQATELLVQIRLPESAGLKGVLLDEEDAEAKPEDVRSAPFKVTFPLGPDGKPEPSKASVTLTSPAFHPPSQIKNLFIPPDADADVLHFLLTPMRTGKLTVLVELQWEDATRGSRSLRTECVATAASAPPNPQMNLVRVPVHVSVGGPSGTPAVKQQVNVSHGEARHAAGSQPAVVWPPYEPPVSRPASSPAPRPAAPSPPLPVVRAAHPPSAEDGTIAGYAYRKLPEPVDYQAQSARPAPAEARRGPERSKVAGRTTIVVAIIGAVSAIVGSYWQYGYKPSHPLSPLDAVTVSGKVLNGGTSEFVPNAQVTVALDSGTAPLENYADSSGSYSFNLGKVQPGTAGRIYVHAPGFEGLEKNFVVTDRAMRDELRLKPVQNPPPPPKSTGVVVAGRVVDAGTNIGLGHANISFAGRSEAYVTDDNGNFRIRMGAPSPSEGVRLLVRKSGCTSVDQVVNAPVENLILMLNCAPSANN